MSVRDSMYVRGSVSIRDSMYGRDSVSVRDSMPVRDSAYARLYAGWHTRMICKIICRMVYKDDMRDYTQGYMRN